jgi:Fe-S-cluster containining protein
MSTSSKIIALDCTTCGACCAYSESWPVFGDEPDDLMDGIPIEMCDCDHGRMKCNGDRCVALHGEIGLNVACSIYTNRPFVCRDFQPGSDGCVYVRNFFKL